MLSDNHSDDTKLLVGESARGGLDAEVPGNGFLWFYYKWFFKINQWFFEDFDYLLIIDGSGDSSYGPLSFRDRDGRNGVLVAKYQSVQFFEGLEVKSLVDPSS